VGEVVVTGTVTVAAAAPFMTTETVTDTDLELGRALKRGGTENGTIETETADSSTTSPDRGIYGMIATCVSATYVQRWRGRLMNRRHQLEMYRRLPWHQLHLRSDPFQTGLPPCQRPALQRVSFPLRVPELSRTNERFRQDPLPLPATHDCRQSDPPSRHFPKVHLRSPRVLAPTPTPMLSDPVLLLSSGLTRT
jgi:hypothetical protein